MNELPSYRRMPASLGLTFGCSTAQLGLTQCCQTCEPGWQAFLRKLVQYLHPQILVSGAAFGLCRCHFTHGNSVVDAYKSLELARTAWAIATGGDDAEAADPNMPFSRGVLKPGGSLVMKLLQGSGEACSVVQHYVVPEHVLLSLHSGI
jgi:hypothetical protein